MNPKPQKSSVNFDKTIAGFNITENGVKSFSKSFKVGPIQFTMNLNKDGARTSIGIPGTGISKRNIKLF